jgi:CHASE1-domain containing sensor protein
MSENDPKKVLLIRHSGFWLSFMVLMAGLMLTVGLWNRSRAADQNDVAAHFDGLSRDALTRIEDRLHYYEQALLGARGLFQASESVTRAEFAVFIAGFKLYPGIQGIGFSVLVPAAEKEQHLSQIRSQGFPDY